jgi:5'-3' exoribonuclease 1
MLYRYLEGMQWVLFYYYKGAQHWRWYYPYHYAPMISDLGFNIVSDFLGGQNTISSFRVDTNCSEDPKPYTPFQQLLCILPTNSLRKFLPAKYLSLTEGELTEFFPDDFEVDLNGRTLPWEAAILIPFADETLFLEQEKRLFDRGMQLNPEEWKRNTTNFVYPAYFFDGNRIHNPQSLQSTLREFGKLKVDLCGQED